MSAITVCLDEPLGVISPRLHGQFAEHLGNCVEDGLWVGAESRIPNIGGLRTSAVEALRRIRVPVLRWPGGCYADDYHWRDGIGPAKERPRTVNIHWGCTIEDNQFGTHEFIRLCRLIGAEPYLAGNVGSGSVRELRDWVEYCNFPGDSTLARRRGQNGSPEPFGVKYWGVGNELWGCGGHFEPEDYALEYRRYATFLRDFGGTELFLIACGPDGNCAAWTRRFFTKLARFPRIHGFAAHYYCGTAGTATAYSTEQWYQLLRRSTRMEDLILEQRALMDEFDPQRRIGLMVDEWGTWHPPTPGRNPRHLWQQNTLRDALVAAITLDIFNRHAEKLVMANIAQAVNVLQAMMLCEGERFVLTPTYHVFDMYQQHQGARAVRTILESPSIAFADDGQAGRLPGLMGSASVQGGELTLSVVNPHANLPVEAVIQLRGGACREGRLTVLCDEDLTAHNTFDEPGRLVPRAEPFAVEGVWRHTFPAASVTVFRAPLG